MNDSFRNSTTLDELLGYLDSVESTVAQDFVLPDLSHAQELQEEVARKITDLEFKLKESVSKEEKAKEELQKTILRVNEEQEVLKNKFSSKMNTQKRKYEEIISRHQQMMDSLIQEKASLGKECENMAKRVQIAREEAARREKEVQEQAATQIAQQRELAIAQERARQKKTLETRIKEVKEETVKALQPELEALISRQKREIESFKSEKDDEIRSIRMNCERRAEEERARLVEQLNKERKSEYDSMEDRLQRQIERERDLHKLEIDRLIQKIKQIEDTKVDTASIAKADNEALINETRERWKAELASEQLKHSQEMEKLKESINERINRAVEEERVSLKIAEDEIKKKLENSLREKNEKKLALVVKKLEEESTQLKYKYIEESDRKIKEAQSLTQKALSSLEEEKVRNARQVSLLKAGIEDEKEMYKRLEKENERIIAEIESQKVMIQRIVEENKQKEIQIAEFKAISLEREKQIRLSFEDKVSEFMKQNEALKSQIESNKLQWDNEKLILEEQHQNELASVSKKVKSLIETKEQTISSLKDQLSVAQKRLREIEDLLHNQKKNMLVGGNSSIKKK